MSRTNNHARWSAGLLASALVAAAMVSLAQAEPLAKEACDAAKTEQDTLVTGGIKDDLAKGPDWAKGNLKPDRLKQIQRYIELEETLNFRCGLASARFTLPEPPVEAAQPPAEAAPKPKPKARPKPKAAAVPDPSAAPAAAEPGKTPQPATDAPVAKPQPKPQPKPQAAPKPKVDDAYRPPQQANPGADPFAKQVAPKQ